MAEKTNANIGFEKQLWDAACVLWGHIPAAEYTTKRLLRHQSMRLGNKSDISPPRISVHI